MDGTMGRQRRRCARCRAAQRFEMDGFEDDALDADRLQDEIDEFEDGDALEGECGDALDAGDASSWDDDFEALDDLADEDDASDLEAFQETVEEAFADAADAANQDEFMARVHGNLQVSGVLNITPGHVHRAPHTHHRINVDPIKPPEPVWKQLVRQALPTAERVVQAGARSAGGALGGYVGGRTGAALGGLVGPEGALVGGALGRVGGRYLGRWAGGSVGGRVARWGGDRIRSWLANPMDAMDAFAELAADSFESEASYAALTPVLSGLAGRFAVRAALPPVARKRNSDQTRRFAAAVSRATRHATETILRRHGRNAVRSVPKVVRLALRDVSEGRIPLSAVPAAIAKRARRVASERPLAVQLSQPNQPARRLCAAAGLQPGRRLPAHVSSPPETRARSVSRIPA